MTSIRIRIRPDGTIDAETQGLKGDACLPYISVLAEVCGAEVIDSAFTSEFYEQAGSAQEQGTRVELEE